METWSTLPLHELCDVTSSKRIYARELVPEGVPFYKSREIIDKVNGKTDHSNPLFISEEKFLKIQDKHGPLSTGDLLLTSRGTLGVPYNVKEGDRFHFADGNLTWFRKFNVLDKYFLKYFFLSPKGKAELSKCVIGSSQQAYTISALKNVKIPLPPLPTQKRIADILSTYDDLIENNRRRIQILEEMAQNLYREWFVKFRFPIYREDGTIERIHNPETDKMRDSQLGLVPEGWEVKTVGEILEKHIGGGWGNENLDEKHTVSGYVVRGTDIPPAKGGDIDGCPFRFHKESNMASRKLEKQDIVFEVSGGSKGQPVGRSLYITERLLRGFDDIAMCASFCKLLRVNPSRLAPVMFYLHLTEIYDNGIIDKYQVQSTGITNFKFQFFLDSEQVIVPPKKIQEVFAEKADNFFSAIHTLGAKNNKLKQTRDLLLPKLISGKIEVA